VTSNNQQLLMNNNRSILALDVGGRRIGVAIASTAARLASPLTTIDVQKTANVFEEVLQLARTHEAQTIVIGLPRGLDGQETGQTAEAREFAKSLQEKSTELVITMQDEAGTSLQAEELLRERGKPYGKEQIDAEAACLILRDYLQQSVEHTA
jgi:putative Holliday junction resolvase